VSIFLSLYRPWHVCACTGKIMRGEVLSSARGYRAVQVRGHSK